MNPRISILLSLVVASLVGGCVGEPSKEPPIVPIRNMYNQPRYDSQSKAPFFEDGRTMRPMVEGTIPREADPEISHATGRTDDDAEWLLEIPAPIVERMGGMAALVERGEERYGIYCSVCHGDSGDGRGVVALRADAIGASAMLPPTFHDERLRSIPDGQLYAIIKNGIRNMPAYKHSIPQDDRWAIVSYVRALQISQASLGETAMNNTEQEQ
ncbi:MAG: cytochrome c [Sandaracinaceae bacterium]|nr:cytochrome c [Sandaracinaceae bacterium]